MTTIAIAMVKDEADIVGSTVEHMRTQVDHVIVADNGSTDDTRAILHDLGVEVLDDPEPGYYQSRKMTNLADYAGRLGADWIVPFDADEWWYSPLGRIADVLDRIQAWKTIAVAQLFDHVATALDPDIDDPVKRLAWRRLNHLPLVKVAFRYRPGVIVEQGNHNATFTDGTAHNVRLDLLEIRHFPYRSPEHFVRKARNGAAAYAATDLGADVGGHWRQYGRLIADGGDEVGYGIFRDWFYSDDPESDTGLIYDPAR